ncbi:MAG: hypothetical protein M5U34_46050 [Chloroflexi bacterium]|nr:hypothetical protein [Chloroflexota bacterium]
MIEPYLSGTMLMQEFLNLTESAPLSLPTLIINLILTLLLAVC